MATKCWVYVNHPNNKALIHLSTCSHCNDGEGRAGADKEDNGEWFGPYTTEKAIRKAQGSEKNLRRWCGFCANRLGINPEFLEN